MTKTGEPIANKFFQAEGGTLAADAPSYIARPADDELYQSVLAGDYCYVLTPRQMGKSSLMTKTAARLRDEKGIHVAVVDLSGIGGDATSMTADQWYYGLANRLLRELKITMPLADWWEAHIQLPPLDRLMIFFEDIILARLQGPVVIFVDEIDTTIKLPFSDDFFAAIRACFNARANKPSFKRFSFVLLGVASPTELIRDAARTPFNIGKRIDLADFTEEEASLFLRGFMVGVRGDTNHQDDSSLNSTQPTAVQLLKRILYWTNGHPFLTQRLCVQVLALSSLDEAKPNPGSEVGRNKPALAGVSGKLADQMPETVAERPYSGLHPVIHSTALPSGLPQTPEALVDAIVAAEFLGQGRRTQDEHLKVIHDRITQTGANRLALLKLYFKVLKRKPVADQPQSPIHSALKLSGLVKTDAQGQLVVRNPIYAQVFDARWVKRLNPSRWKQRTALGLALTSAIVFGWWIGTQQLTVRSGAGIILAWLGIAYPEPEMVEIPGGSFRMGSPANEEGRQDDEGPVHTVTMAKPFLLGKYELTFDEYDVFAFLIKGEGGCADGHEVSWPSDEGWGRGKRPVINVSWQDATCYAEWLSRKTKKPYRLPSEAEWEYAARAGTETSRPWPGDVQAACRYANGLDRGSVEALKQRYASIDFEQYHPFPCSDGYAYTAPVGQFKPNLFELRDMLGNVWEWVADCYHDSYQTAPTDGSAWNDGMKCASIYRALRGGSWFFETRSVRSAFRDRYATGFRSGLIGFRLAQD